MLTQIQATIAALPYFVPGMIGAVVVGLVVLAAVPKNRVATALFSWWFVLMAILAVDPHGGAVRHACTLDTWLPLHPSHWLDMSSDALNIWVFVIFGVLVPWTWKRGRMFLAALALPMVIEIVQRTMSRDCNSFDVVNNWAGLLVGAVASMIVRLLTGRR